MNKVVSSDGQPIAITGDLADEYTDLSMLRPLVSKLCAIAPVFYVTGNHEWVLTREKRQQLFEILDECGVIAAKAAQPQLAETVR